MSTHPPSFICIEGCIGVGKTTLLENLRKKVDASVPYYTCPEKGFETLLKLFTNPKTCKDYAGHFQLFMLFDVISRIEIGKEVTKSTSSFAVCERSCLGNKAFYALNKASGNMDKSSCTVYDIVSSEKNADAHFDVMFYLDISPEVSMKRIAMRGRPGEEKYTLSYIESLDKAMFSNILNEAIKRDDENPLPIVMVDWTQFGKEDIILSKLDEIHKLPPSSRICPRVTVTNIKNCSDAALIEECVIVAPTLNYLVDNADARKKAKDAFIKGITVHVVLLL